MRVGVNTRFLLKHKMEGFGWFTFEIFSRIVRAHPEVEFIFFFDRKYDEQFVFSKNVTPIVIAPQARHPILFKWWFNRSIPKALKKYKCDVFISPDGYLSLKTSIPQLAVIHDLSFEHHPEDFPKTALKYLKSYFPLFAKKAARIVTVSEYSKQDIVKTYGVSPEKIDVIYNGVSAVFEPLRERKQLEIKEKYTNHQPYLLFVGAIHKRKNLQRLITAYKKLKTETNHPHHLVIVGTPMWESQQIQIPKELKSNIHFTGHLDQASLAQVVATAELLCLVSYFEGFGLPLIEAMKAGTPVLAGNLTALPEVGGDAAVYCDPMDEQSIFEKLDALLSTPEDLKQMREKGLSRAQQFSWDQSAEKLWESIMSL